MKQGETYVNGNRDAHNGNPYSRKSGSAGMAGDVMGTYVPGMHENAPGVNPAVAAQKNDTPVIGFLYSISRKGIGEYWPLHLGTNTIGRSYENDVCLKEMSVSDKHAVISIKQMKSTHKLIASIRDVGSKNGMYLNDEELDYDNHPCQSNDIITIGANYKLLLLLIDAEEYGLTIADNFVATDEDDVMDMSMGDFQPMNDSTQNPYSTDNRNIDSGTVDLNGGQSIKPGGTKFM